MGKERWGESTNGGDGAEIKEVADPVNAGDNRDRLFRKVENVLGKLFGLVTGVLSGHGGEEGATE